MPPPCKFYNSDGGCRNPSAACSRPHVPVCTNEVCVEAGKQNTHTHADCGRKGGGSHGKYIEKQRNAAILKKVAAQAAEPVAERAAEAVATRNPDLDDRLYYTVLGLLENSKATVYNDLMTKFPLPLSAVQLTRKVTGMIIDASDNEEILELVTDPTKLFTTVVDATVVLHNHHTAKAEAEGE
jgi:hypothetical protein